MKRTMTVKETAERWGISSSGVTALCRKGKIPGVVKEGSQWLIPADAEKPADGRVKNGTYQKSRESVKLPLPIGVSEYRVASTQYYYIDKTMMIKDFLDERPMVSLFTRPRRFGKTLNMDMLRTFFEKTDEDTSVYFKNKKIWSCGKQYQQYQGRYPVIFLTFKDVKCSTWEETYDMLTMLIRLEYRRHSELDGSAAIRNQDFYHKIVREEATENDYMLSLMMLSQMLDEHHGIAPIIIIDEYDTPIQQGHMRGFYDSVILFMRNLFSGGLKDNRHLSYGFLTGILRVAKESIFSGLNNLKVNSILDQKYSAYFGFTAEEVREMAEYYNASDRFEELCTWYDGYRFGRTEIFNPWSVINYFSNECMPRPFWQATGSNEIIGEILAEADEGIYERLNKLLQGETVLTYIDTDVIYPQIKSNPSSVYSFLLVAGYLKAVRSETSFSGDFMCEVALPNREIATVYNKEILQKLNPIIPQAAAISIQEALYTHNVQALGKGLHQLLMQSASYLDTAQEIFYHGLVLGLCAMMDDRYLITSNRESGLGRYDIQLMPRDQRLPGILIELKAGKNLSEHALKASAEGALQQIKDCAYDTNMKAAGVENILRYGVAFSGKNVEIAAE